MCSPAPICAVFDGQDAARELLTKFDKWIIDSCTQGLVSLGNVWLKTKTPDLTTGASTHVSGPAPESGNIETILGYLTWIGLAVALLSLIALGGLIAVRIRSGEGMAAVGRLGAVLGGVLILSGATAVVTAVLPRGSHGVGGATGFIQSSLWWYTAVAATGSVIIGAIRMIWEQRAQPGRDLVKSLLTLIVVAAAGVTIVNMLIGAADSFSAWIIDNAMACSNGDPGCFVAKLKTILELGEDSGGGNGILMMMIIAIGELLTLLIQMVLMVARSGMLVLLAGILPIAASATNTEMGNMWFKRCISWLVAFLLYKPVASLIYAAAFRLIMDEGPAQDQLLGALTGAMLLILAVLALPALLRFVAPMTSAASSGHGAGAAVTTALATRLPSGARASAAGGGQQAHNATTTTTTQVGSPSGSAGQAGGAQQSGGGSTGGQATGLPAAGGNASRIVSGSSTDESTPPNGGVQVVTTTETSNHPGQQATRGRRFGGGGGGAGGAGATALVQAAAMAASAAHAVTEEATGSQR